MTTKLEQKIDSMITDLNDGRHQQAKDAITLLAKEISRWTLEQVMPLIHEETVKKEMKMLQRCWSKGHNLYSIVCERVNSPFFSTKKESEEFMKDMKLKAKELGIEL